MSDYLEVVWYSTIMDKIGVTYSGVDALEYIDFTSKDVIILELNLISETPNENE